MQSVDAAGLAIGGDAPPRIMGVLNVSPESPYDPSVYTAADEAAEYADDLIGEGADIVDVGLATANKRFRPLTAEEELDRLELAAETIASVSRDAVFSIETRYHEVAQAAIDRGFELVNDVCGFADPAMPTVCADHGVAVIKMASPPDLTAPGAVETVDDIHAAITRNGFTDKTIIDPAFGGWSEEKTLADDRETFSRLGEFRAYGRPILVSINRKNFLRELADRSTEAALSVSLAATSLAIERGADVIRTHDVAETRDAAIIGHELGERPVGTHRGPATITQLDTDDVARLHRQLDIIGVDTARAGDVAWDAFCVDGIEAEPWTVEQFEAAGITVLETAPLVVAGPARSWRRLAGVAESFPAPMDDVVEVLATAGG